MLDQAPNPTTVTPSAETTASTPAVSTPKTGILSRVVARLTPQPREAEPTVEEPTAEAATGSLEAPATEEVAPSSPPVVPSDGWVPPATREEYDEAIKKAAQAETDRRERKRQQDAAQHAEEQREQRLTAMEQQYREARRQHGDDSIEAAELSAQIDDLRQGIERDWNDAQTREQLYSNLSLQAARATHTAAFTPLLHGLPDAEVNELGEWYRAQTTPDAQGRLPMGADEALGKLAMKITEARDEHIRQQVVDGLFDEIKTDAVLRQQLNHLLNNGDFEEPEHLVGGSPAGLPSDEELDRMTPDQYRALKLTPEAEKRLLTRSRRN